MNYIPGTTSLPQARTILDAAEFARLIRKHRRVGVHIRDYDGHGVAYIYVPAKQILQALERGSLDGLVWSADVDGVDVTGCPVPEPIRLRRAIPRLRAQLATERAYCERLAARQDLFGAASIDNARRNVVTTERDLAAAERRLAALRSNHALAA